MMIDDIALRQQKVLAEAKEFAQIIVETVRESLVVLDSELKVVSANPSFYQTFKVEPKETIGFFIYDLGNGQWDIPKLRTLLEDILPKKNTFENYEMEHTFETIGQKSMLLNARRLDDLHLILLAIEDVTEMSKAEEKSRIAEGKIKKSEEKYRSIYTSSRDAIMTLEPPTWKFTSGNAATIAMFGAKNEQEFLSYEPWKLSPEYQPDGSKSAVKAKEMIDKAMEEGTLFFEWTHKALNGKLILVDVLLSKVETENGAFLQATVRDISERKNAEKLKEESLRLTASNILLQQVIETIPVRIFWKDNNFTFLGCNTLFAKDAGKNSPEELIGKTDYDMGWKKEADMYRKDDALVMSKNKAKINYEEIQTNPKGKQIWLRTSKIPLKNEHNSIIGILGTYEDITERKRVEKALFDLNSRQNAILQSIPDIIMEVNTDKVYTWTNQPGRDFFGDDVIGKTADFFFEGSQTVYKDIQPIFQGSEDTMYIESWQRRKDGEKRLLAWWCRTIKDAEGRVVGALSSARDITDQKRMEQEIIDDKLKDEAIIDSIGDAVFATDIDGTIVLFNDIAEQLTGVSEKDALGRKYHDIVTFIKESDGMPGNDFISEAMTQDKLTRMVNHTILVSKDGRRIPILESASPIKNSQEQIIGCVVAFHDITIERQVDKAKTEFVSLASHQLRTPLATINWYSELLLSKDDNTLTLKQRQYAEETYRASKRMVSLVNSLLNISRLELGTFVIEPESIDIVQAIKLSLHELHPKIVMKHLTIKETYDTHIGSIQADPKLLSIVFQNLLSNAVKYTQDKGTIFLDIKEEKSGILISVKDTGIGIPQYQQDKIFTKLFRGDNVHKIDTDGSGLGLYIVHEIVSSSGGKIWFESHEGKGSTFFVSLPKEGMKKRKGGKKLI